ncbi:MAG TPA: T9SS type A sorting domain-containing protein [Bacteroidetes bacterium]|nr:T9SS type A sorting domain-containing protein [Bacteroidota bacterium]
MMKQIFTIIMLIIGFSQVSAQWYQVNTNTSENLYDIFFLDSLEGYCVGGSDYWGTPQSTGVILKTTDGGENWSTIFSKDSLTIRNIAIVEETGNKKLYAFGAISGVSYLVSTFINTPLQNWTVIPVGYKPRETKVYNNSIYFVDELDNKLKLLNSNIASVLISNVTYFDVSSHGIICLDMFNFQVLNSFDYGVTWDIFPTFPTTYQSSNSGYGSIKYTTDGLIVLKGTYPGIVVHTSDYGLNWTTNYNAPEFGSIILNTGLIIGITNLNELVFSSDFGANWNPIDTFNGEKDGARVKFVNGNSGFLIGKDGLMYKGIIDSATVGINNLDIKKKINIYPNPAKDVLQIDVSNSIEIENIELFDISGKKAKTYSSNDRNLNISGLSAGTYFLRVSTTEGGVTKKVIIE